MREFKKNFTSFLSLNIMVVLFAVAFALSILMENTPATITIGILFVTSIYFYYIIYIKTFK